MMWPGHTMRRARGLLTGENTSLYIILMVSFLHLTWAALLLWTPAAAHSTPVAAVISVFHSRAGAVAALAGTGVLALVAAWFHQNPTRIATHPRYLALALIPQQVLLFMSAAGGITAAIRGHYADGVARPWQFIIGDQLPVILVALLYTTAILIAGRARRP